MPLDDVTPTDDKCAPLAFQSGDTSADGLLDNGETWIYTCTATVAEATVDTVTVTGQPIDLGAPLGGGRQRHRYGRGARPPSLV